MIIAVDREGVISYYNDGARQNLGYAPEEVIGKPCTDSIYPSIEEARRVMRAMRESPNGNRIASFETAFRNKAGQSIPVMISAALSTTTRAMKSARSDSRVISAGCVSISSLRPPAKSRSASRTKSTTRSNRF